MYKIEGNPQKHAYEITQNINSNIIVKVDAAYKDELIYHLIENGGYLASPKQRDMMFEAAKTTKSLKAILSSMKAVTYSLHKFIVYELNADDAFKDTVLDFGAVGVICENNNKRRLTIKSQ